MSAKDAGVIVGGEPRIDFLPPEIRQKKAARRTVRGLIMLAAVVLALCVVVYATVTTVAITAQARLSQEQSRTQELLGDQADYSSVRLLQQTVQSATDARIVASGNEIMWKPVVDAAVAALPANQGIMEATIDSYVVGEAPPEGQDLQKPYEATIQLKVLFDRVRTIADWTDSLLALPQVANVSFGGATLNDDGLYESIVVLHVDASQFERRYFETPRAEEEEVAP